MVTTYGEQLDIATQDLAVATVRLNHPSSQPTPHSAGALVDVAAAIAHLGTTIGPGPEGKALTRLQRSRDHLRAVLSAGARVSVARPPAEHAPVGAELDIVDAASALRTAADLLASTGPLPDELTDRYLNHSEWTAPRPDTLHSEEALAGAWSQLADLTHTTADLAARLGPPELAVHAETWRRAALAIPAAPADLHLELAKPGWPLPLPYRDVPGEWDGRMAELTAIAWRVGSIRAPRPNHAHPIGALRGIADICHGIYRRSADTAADPREAADLRERAQIWRRIAACTHCIHTPADRLSSERTWSLARTRYLVHTAELDHLDLLTGRTVATLAAHHIATGLERNYTEHPAVKIGPEVQARELRRDPEVAIAAVNRRAITIPKTALIGLLELYRAASVTNEMPAPRETLRSRRRRLDPQRSLSTASRTLQRL